MAPPTPSKGGGESSSPRQQQIIPISLLLLLLLLLPSPAPGFLIPNSGSSSRLPSSSNHRRLPPPLLKAATIDPFPRNATDGGGPGAGGVDACPFHKTSTPQPHEAAAALPYAPGPIRWPLVGNMLSAQFKYGGIDKFDAAMQVQYGSIVRTKLLGRDWHVISDPNLAREVLLVRAGEGEGDFSDRFVARPIARLFGNNGIIFAQGLEWATNRRLSLPAFHRPEILERASAVVVALAKSMAAGWADRCAKEQQQQQTEGDGPPSPSSSSSSITVDLHDDMRCLTLEAVAQASFSLRLGLLEKGLAEGRMYEYDDAGNKGGGDAYDVGAADAGAGNKGSRRKKRRFTGKRVDFLVREGFRLMGHAIRFPIPGADRVGLNPPFRRLSKVHAELQAIEASILDSRRAERAALRARGAPLPESRDLLDVYLEAMEQEKQDQGDGDADQAAAALDDASIFRNINDIFLAGSDTTATTISALIFEIVRRPRVLARVESELASLDLDNPAHMLPHALAQRLPYLELCIKETLRLYPVAINLSRVAVRETSLGGFRIPKGAVVSPSVRNLHLDTTLWGADAAEYRPERWEGALEGGLPKGVPQGAYIPFGAGPRVCLGLRFALIEALAVSAVLLKSLKLASIDPARELDVFYPAAMSFRGGVPVLVEGRK